MQSSLKLIGNTPIYKLENQNIYIKLEKFNLGGSIKDRTVLGMILDAKQKGFFNQNTVLIEASSGNTGISIAMLSRIFNYKTIIIMPETMSIERRQIIKSYGAQLILTDGKLGMKGSIEKCEQLLSQNENYLNLNQFGNQSNVDMHYKTTGIEIINQVSDINVFVAGIGTGGSFTGISKKLKENNYNTICVAVEPLNSSVISGNKAGSHNVQGIGAGFIPKILDQNLIDEIITVTDEQSINETLNFVKQTGILVGISSGANIFAAKKISEKYPNKNIVTLSPDGGEKYLSVLNKKNI